MENIPKSPEIALAKTDMGYIQLIIAKGPSFQLLLQWLNDTFDINGEQMKNKTQESIIDTLKKKEPFFCITLPNITSRNTASGEVRKKGITLEEIETQFPEYLRVSRSTIINPIYIKGFSFGKLFYFHYTFQKELEAWLANNKESSLHIENLRSSVRQSRLFKKTLWKKRNSNQHYK